MKIIRSPRERHFTILPNEALDNPALSFKARGLLAYLLSKPDGWRTDSMSLASAGPNNRDAIRTGLNELEKAGYLHREKDHDEHGHWVTRSYITDTPFFEESPGQTRDGFSGAGQSGAGESGAGKSGPIPSTGRTKKQNPDTNTSPATADVEVPQSKPWKQETPVDDAGGNARGPQSTERARRKAHDDLFAWEREQQRLARQEQGGPGNAS